jgi:asparagine synthase (glutamine-hydrolysing)
MSIQFGRWNTDGKPVDRDYIERVKPVIAPYGPDDGGSYSKGGISILYRAFRTTTESCREAQPHLTESGAVITWDGRLDNRADLIRQLPNVLAISSTDVSIVAAAYEEWGTDCFAKLVGDWALTIWDAKSRSLHLAKDAIGTRHLYYSIDRDEVTWSTILDPLVLFAGKSFALCEEYLAGWLSFFPATHLTPYVGIHSVPPSSSVVIRNGKRTVTKYWDFDPSKPIRYNTDAEYEEHFRAVFAEAVRRRLRSNSPVLAELSGGMDSSSIVCMADTIMTDGGAEIPRLDTMSYYNDSEPNWNERPYFTTVEERRGRTGCHIDVAKQEPFLTRFGVDRFAATPASGCDHPSETRHQLVACMASQGDRVVLSGTGGDEVTGGIPTQVPMLANLFAQLRIWSLAHHLKISALQLRRPWFHLLFETLTLFFSPSMLRVSVRRRPSPWLTSSLKRRHRRALTGYEKWVNPFGPLPSFQIALNTLEGLQRLLSSLPLSQNPLVEIRYPFLDRSLLEFLFAIPPEQLVRPGQRRSLMRRSLTGIVPDEILLRKRKAFVSRAPLTAISKEWTILDEMCRHMFMGSVGIVDARRFLSALQEARSGQQVRIVSLLRTITLEAWMRHISKHGFVDFRTAERKPDQSYSALRAGSLFASSKTNLS